MFSKLIFSSKVISSSGLMKSRASSRRYILKEIQIGHYTLLVAAYFSPLNKTLSLLHKAATVKSRCCFRYPSIMALNSLNVMFCVSFSTFRSCSLVTTS